MWKQSDYVPFDNKKDYSHFCSKISNKRVLVYIPSGTESLHASTVEGLFDLLWDCTKWQKYGFEFIPMVGRRMPLPNARTSAVEFAIDNNCGYILWIDDDMVMMPGTDAFSRLLVQDRDVVAPLFYTRYPPHLPCVFSRKFRAQKRFCTFENIMDYPKDTLIQVDGIGFGLVLTKVEAFKKTPKPWFLYSDTFGEDLFFCSRAIDSGVEIFCDTSFSVGHIGPQPVIFEDTYNAFKDAAKEYARQKVANEELQSKKYELACDIVMLCYKNFEITKTAIESIFNFSGEVDIHLIVINDGNDKDLSKYFERISRARPNVTVVTHKEAQGWVKSVNAGLAHTKHEYILVANNDIEIYMQYSFWLSSLISALMIDPKCGAAGPKSDYVMGLQNIANDEIIKMPAHYAKFLIGFCFMIRKDALAAIGGKMDERFGLGGNDDLDWSIALRKAGYTLKVVREAFVHHVGSQSIPQVTDIVELDNDTRKLLIEKWGDEVVNELFTISEQFLIEGKQDEPGDNQNQS